MEKKYVVSGFGAIEEAFIEVNIEHIASLKEAERNLVNILYIEEKFNIIVENFLEYEQELFNVNLNKMYFPIRDTDWALGVADIHALNRRLINLLTTTKLYLDQVSHDLNVITQKKIDVKSFLKEITRSEYDGFLGYRVMEALRNYVQHRGLPIHILTHSVQGEEIKDKRKVKHVIAPHIKIEKLREDGKFKTGILNELEALEDEVGFKQHNQINIKHFVRQYVDCLGRVQSTIRQALKEDVEKWDSIIEEMYRVFKDRYGETEMLYVAELHHSGMKYNRELIPFKFIERRRWLVSKNENFNSIDNLYISTDN